MEVGDQFVWQRSAACKDVPLYLFFPEEQMRPGFKPDPKFEGVTFRDFCGSCPVMWRCREFAVIHGEHGIWGGLTEGERNKQSSAVDKIELREYKFAAGEYVPLYGHYFSP